VLLNCYMAKKMANKEVCTIVRIVEEYCSGDGNGGGDCWEIEVAFCMKRGVYGQEICLIAINFC
jgi:hypothetical protein